MKLLDLQLKFVIDDPKGTYRKFADSLDEYPILGVTMPTHYGHLVGYRGEDSDDLDVFIGSGDIHGFLKVNRGDVPGGVETKILVFVTSEEYSQIEEAYKPVINHMKTISEEDLVGLLSEFQT